MTTVNTPFGYNSFRFSNVIVHTMKIRVKAKDVAPNFPYEMVSKIQFVERGHYTTVTFVSTDSIEFNNVTRKMKEILANIMHERINNKYGLLDRQYSYFLNDSEIADLIVL